MYVCICHAVTETEVLAAVDAGANSIASVTACTGAGGTCGTCHDHIEDLVEAACLGCPLASARVA